MLGFFLFFFSLFLFSFSFLLVSCVSGLSHQQTTEDLIKLVSGNELDNRYRQLRTNESGQNKNRAGGVTTHYSSKLDSVGHAIKAQTEGVAFACKDFSVFVRGLLFAAVAGDSEVRVEREGWNLHIKVRQVAVSTPLSRRGFTRMLGEQVVVHIRIAVIAERMVGNIRIAVAIVGAGGAGKWGSRW